jgi:hypothetical protein
LAMAVSAVTSGALILGMSMFVASNGTAMSRVRVPVSGGATH